MLMAVACSPITETRGLILDKEQIENIKIGQTRQPQIREQFGTPTLKSTFSDNVWIYTGSRVEQWAFFEPTVTKHRSVLIEFNEDGVVRDKRVLSKAQLREVDLNPETTPTAGRGLSILQQLLGNIGRFEGQQQEQRR